MRSRFCSDFGTSQDSVIVRRRRYDPSSSRLDVIWLLADSVFGLTPTRGTSVFVFVGVQRFSQRSREIFARGSASVRMRLMLRILPPYEPCSRPVNSRLL